MESGFHNFLLGAAVWLVHAFNLKKLAYYAGIVFARLKRYWRQ